MFRESWNEKGLAAWRCWWERERADGEADWSMAMGWRPGGGSLLGEMGRAKNAEELERNGL